MKKVIVGKSKGLADAEQCDIHVVSKFYKCWNCKNFLIEHIESKENYAKYHCKKHKKNCNITDPKWQTCNDFEVDCNYWT